VNKILHKIYVLTAKIFFGLLGLFIVIVCLGSISQLLFYIAKSDNLILYGIFAFYIIIFISQNEDIKKERLAFKNILYTCLDSIFNKTE
jgi:hypothetical protein